MTFVSKDQENKLSSLTDSQKRMILDFSPWDLQQVRKERENGNNDFISVSGPSEAAKLLNELAVDDIEYFERVRDLCDQADDYDYPYDIELYKKVLNLAPWDSISAMSIGSSYFNVGDYKEAIEWMEKALAIEPDNHRIKSNLEGIRKVAQTKKNS